MSRKKQHSKQFKLNAVQYRMGHPDLSQVECAYRTWLYPIGNSWPQML